MLLRQTKPPRMPSAKPPRMPSALCFARGLPGIVVHACVLVGTAPPSRLRARRRPPCPLSRPPLCPGVSAKRATRVRCRSSRHAARRTASPYSTTPPGTPGACLRRGRCSTGPRRRARTDVLHLRLSDAGANSQPPGSPSPRLDPRGVTSIGPQVLPPQGPHDPLPRLRPLTKILRVPKTPPL